MQDTRATPAAAYALTAIIAALLLAVLLFLWSHQGRPLPTRPALPARPAGAVPAGAGPG